MISDLGNHNIGSENSQRSAGEKPYGGSEIVSHRLKASANSFEGPEICVASNSAKQIALRRLWQWRAIMARPFSEDEKAAAPTLWEETMSEVDLGFLEGPYFSEKAITDQLMTDAWSMTPRFVLFQGEERKPRVIDNFKASNINDAYGSSSYLDLHDTDFLSCFLVFLGELHTCGDWMKVHLSTGEVLSGRKNESMRGDVSLEGRGVDLSKAYKQVGILPSSVRHSVLGVRKACGSSAYFISRSLPFEASASVFAFNKLTRALWGILV